VKPLLNRGFTRYTARNFGLKSPSIFSAGDGLAPPRIDPLRAAT